MPKTKHYSKAPIIEAVIDLRIRKSLSLRIEQLEKMSEIVRDDYPEREKFYQGEISVQVEQGQTPQAKSSSQQVGWQFTNTDKKYSFQARIDGFTFIHHAPYTQWESFRDEARRLWSTYCSVAEPQWVVRAALRYINRFQLPGNEFDLEHYFSTYPQTSKDPVMKTLTGFFVQLQLPQSDLNSILILNQAPVPSDEPDSAAIVLDIDLFTERHSVPWPADAQEIWQLLEQLRQRKNEVFEASITNNTRELIR